MPRRERPLDQGESGLLQFAADLRRLRERAGSPTYRELSRRAHYSAAALSEAAGGRKLPSLAVTRAYAKACAADPDEWERRFAALMERRRKIALRLGLTQEKVDKAVDRAIREVREARRARRP